MKVAELFEGFLSEAVSIDIGVKPSDFDVEKVEKGLKITLPDSITLKDKLFGREDTLHEVMSKLSFVKPFSKHEFKFTTIGGRAMNADSVGHRNGFIVLKTDDVELVKKAIAMAVESIQKLSDKHVNSEAKKQAAKARRKADSAWTNAFAKEKKAKLDALYGKGTWSRVSYRQVNGDDGYCYQLFVDGRPKGYADMTLYQAKYSKEAAVKAIAKREKLGTYGADEKAE